MGDCWLAIENKIYDVSNFQHPGGRQILIDNSGRDATREFLDIGHKNADQHMPELLIGELDSHDVKDRYAATTNKEELEYKSTPIYYYILGAILIIVLLKILEIL